MNELLKLDIQMFATSDEESDDVIETDGHQETYVICENMCLEPGYTKDQVDTMSTFYQLDYVNINGTNAYYKANGINEEVVTGKTYNLIMDSTMQSGNPSIYLSINDGANYYHLADCNVNDLVGEYITVYFNGTNFVLINPVIKSAITASLAADVTASADGVVDIPLKNIADSRGSKFTLTSDGGIRIGSGVNKVLVSANIYYFTATAKGRFLYVNNSAGIIAVRHRGYVGGNSSSNNAPAKVISVTEGMVLKLTAQMLAKDVISAASDETFMTVVEL